MCWLLWIILPWMGMQMSLRDPDCLGYVPRNGIAASYLSSSFSTLRKSLIVFYVPCCAAAQLCLILCNPMDCGPPGSSVHGILQARILDWVAISSSRGSSQPRDCTQVSHLAGGSFTSWATREALLSIVLHKFTSTVYKGSVFSTFLSRVVFFCLSAINHSNSCYLIPYCGFVLHFSDD